MYYTTSGGYRKTKMFIDYSTIVLTVVIVLLFIAILVLRSKSGLLFPAIFLAGGLVNIMGAVKRFLNKQKLQGIVQGAVAAILLLMCVICFFVVI